MNQLIPLDPNDKELANFDDVASNATVYLQRLQLFGSKSDACAEKKIDIGHWGLVNDDMITDLGVTVDVVILAFRPKALDVGGDTVVNNHDADSEIYLSIRERSKVKDSGCMYGPEFLIFIPSEKVFATYFASSATARRESKKIRPLIGCGATLKCKLIDNGRYKWHGPVVLPCSAPLDVPDLEIIKVEKEKFFNPSVSDIEVADEPKNKRER